jgi:N-acyl-D-aspartate/D-glutamate deacylase
MRYGFLGLLISIMLFGSAPHSADVLIQNAHVYDGTGKRPFTADVRVHAGRITAVGPRLQPSAGEMLRDAKGLALSPGFIDMHTHADRGLLKDLDAATVSRQGVTNCLKVPAQSLLKRLV